MTMERAPLFRPQTVFVFGLLTLGLAVSGISWGYGFGSLSQPGPGLYPFFVGLAIAVSALFITLSELKSAAEPVLDRAGAKTFVLMSVTFCLWILAMPLLGYVLVTLLATYAFCKIMKLEGWRKPLAVAAGTTLFIYLLFDYWLYIDLPRGLLE